MKNQLKEKGKKDNDRNIVRTTKKAYFGAGKIQVIMLNINLRFNSTEFRENSGDKI